MADQQDLIPFVIERKTWLRGSLTLCGGLFLLRKSDDMRCCLGQFCERVLNVSREMLCDVMSPDDLRHSLLPPSGQWMLGDSGNSVLAAEMMAINDSRLMSATEREAKLVGLFARAGYRVSFVDELPQAEAQ